jgi:hypothetical protein
MDFEKHYYYVQINLTRRSAEVPLAVMGVFLTD